MAALTWRLGALLCSAGFTMIVSADQVYRTGEDVTLPCKLPSSSQVIVVLWSRTDLGSDYVLLYRDEQIVSSNQHQSFKNRVDLQSRNMKDGDVSLVLKDVRTEDGGTYECKVVQRGKGSNRMQLISTISLEVEALPPAAGVERSLNHEKTAQNQVAKKQAEKNQVVESRANPGVIASLSVMAVLVAVVSVIVWRKRRPDLPPEKEQTSMI